MRRAGGCECVQVRMPGQATPGRRDVEF